MNKMKLYDIYKEIADKTQNKAIINGELNLPETILRSSFIKCLEFNLITSKYEDENLYFYLPILRSICEDIIFINYMFTVIEEEDRLNFIIAYQASDWQKSITAQETYFTANRSFQPILTTKMINDLILSKINIEAIQQTLKNKYCRSLVSDNCRQCKPLPSMVAFDKSPLTEREQRGEAIAQLC